jgi:hypothetical protein
MSLRPFLSHARDDRELLEVTKAELSIAGADGWQDVSDLLVGQPQDAEIRRVIHEEAGGFIWPGTQTSLMRRFINEVEIPAALERARFASRSCRSSPGFGRATFAGGAPKAGALLAVAVDPAHRGVQIDGRRLLARACARRPRPGHRLLCQAVKLAHVADGERMQERPERRGGSGDLPPAMDLSVGRISSVP